MTQRRASSLFLTWKGARLCACLTFLKIHYADLRMNSAEFAAIMLEKGVRVVGSRWTELPDWNRICVGLDHEIEKCHAAAKKILTAV